MDAAILDLFGNRGTREEHGHDGQQPRRQAQAVAEKALHPIDDLGVAIEEEREDLLKYSNSRLLVTLLPVLDEFNMALGQAPNDDAPESWVEGIRLIHRKLHSLIESEGVTRIEAESKSFDPLEHEALAQQESPEHEDGQVMMVVRDGYKLRGRLLRPAQVIVAQKVKANTQTSDEDGKSSKEGED